MLDQMMRRTMYSVTVLVSMDLRSFSFAVFPMGLETVLVVQAFAVHERCRRLWPLSAQQNRGSSANFVYTAISIPIGKRTTEPINFLGFCQGGEGDCPDTKTAPVDAETIF